MPLVTIAKRSFESGYLRLLVSILLLIINAVNANPVPEVTRSHISKPCHGDCDQKVMGNPFEIYPGINEGLGPTADGSNPEINSETLKENPDKTLSKQMKDTYDIGMYSTICWIQITTVTEYLNGSEPTNMTEYAISFETPSNIPEKYDDKAEPNDIYYKNTHKSYMVPFETIERSETTVIKQSKQVTCGSGPLYTQEILTWPAKNRKRLEIRVSPKKKSLYIDCNGGESTDNPNGMSTRLLPTADEEETTASPETKKINDSHVKKTLDIVKDVLKSQETTDQPTTDISETKVIKEQMITDISSIVLAQTTPTSNLSSVTTEMPDVQIKSRITSIEPDGKDIDLDETKTLIKHLTTILSNELTTTETPNTVNVSRISSVEGSTKITPTETNTEDYPEYESDSCEDSDEIIKDKNNSQDVAKDIMNEAKKPKPQSSILKVLKPVDKDPEKQKLIENITMEILHDILITNTSTEVSTSKVMETQTTVPETRMDLSEMSGTTPIPITSSDIPDKTKKSPEQMITEIIKEIAHVSTEETVEETTQLDKQKTNDSRETLLATRITPEPNDSSSEVIEEDIMEEILDSTTVQNDNMKQNTEKTEGSAETTTENIDQSSEEIITEIIDGEEDVVNKKVIKHAPKRVHINKKRRKKPNKSNIDESQTETSEDSTDINHESSTVPEITTESSEKEEIPNKQKTETKPIDSSDLLATRITVEPAQYSSIKTVEEHTTSDTHDASESTTIKTGRKKQKINAIKKPKVKHVEQEESEEEYVTEIIEVDDEDMTENSTDKSETKKEQTNAAQTDEIPTTEKTFEQPTTLSVSLDKSKSEETDEYITEQITESEEEIPSKSGNKKILRKRKHKKKPKHHHSKHTTTIQTPTTITEVPTTSTEASTTTTEVPKTTTEASTTQTNIATRIGDDISEQTTLKSTTHVVQSVKPLKKKKKNKKSSSSVEEYEETTELVDISSSDETTHKTTHKQTTLQPQDPSSETEYSTYSVENTQETSTQTTKQKKNKPRKWRRIHVIKKKPHGGKPIQTQIVSEEILTEDDDRIKLSTIQGHTSKKEYKKTTENPADTSESTTAYYEGTSVSNPSSENLSSETVTTEIPEYITKSDEIRPRITDSFADEITTARKEQLLEYITEDSIIEVPYTSESTNFETNTHKSGRNRKQGKRKIIHKRRKKPKSTVFLEQTEVYSEEGVTQEITEETNRETTESTKENNKETSIKQRMETQEEDMTTQIYYENFPDGSTEKPQSISQHLAKTEKNSEAKKLLKETNEKSTEISTEKLSETNEPDKDKTNQETQSDSHSDEVESTTVSDKKKIQEAFIKDLLETIQSESIDTISQTTVNPNDEGSLSTIMLPSSVSSPTAGAADVPICDPVNGVSTECLNLDKKQVGIKPNFIAKSKKNGKIECFDVGKDVKQIICPKNTNKLPFIDNLSGPNDKKPHSSYLIKINELEKLLDLLCTKKLNRLRSQLLPKTEKTSELVEQKKKHPVKNGR